MQRVAELLSESSYRHAFVRLWVLGQHAPTLREWELRRGEMAKFELAKGHCAANIEAERPFETAAVDANPLAVLQVLDHHLYVNRANSAPSQHARNNPATQILESGNFYWLQTITLNARRRSALAKQPGNLSYWLQHHCVIPAKTPHGIVVKLQFSRSEVAEKLASLWSAVVPQLKVWIAHFNDQAILEGSTVQSAVGDWRAQRVEPAEIRAQSMFSTLRQAEQAGAHVVIFPELTVDIPLRNQLIQHLRHQPAEHLVMLQAGSFHETVADEGKTFNTAPLLSSQGRGLFVHRKLRPFSKIEPDIGPVTEDISLGDSIHVLVTPIGLLSVLICKDFLDEAPSTIGLLSDVPVEWILVPSFGDEKTIHQHKVRAKANAQVRTGLHVALAQTFNNIDDPQRQPTECVRGFGHIGGNPSPEPQVPENGGLVVFPLQTNDSPPIAPPRPPALKRVK